MTNKIDMDIELDLVFMVSMKTVLLCVYQETLINNENLALKRIDDVTYQCVKAAISRLHQRIYALQEDILGAERTPHYRAVVETLLAEKDPSTAEDLLDELLANLRVDL